MIRRLWAAGTSSMSQTSHKNQRHNRQRAKRPHATTSASQHQSHAITEVPAPEPDVTNHPPRVELIVKLGGCCLTHKATHRTLDTLRFEHAMDSIARLYRAGVPFILVHGAGSYGHFEAAQYNIPAGNATSFGMAATHATVVELNSLVVAALIKRNVPAVGVSPLLVPGRIRNDLVATVLDRGHLPVLHGDVCYSADGRTAILSGDVLVTSLALWFEFVNRVVYVTDVPGVLAHPPLQSMDDNALERALIRRITVNDSGDVNFCRPLATSERQHDVTGGIRAKIMSAARCVSDSKGRISAFVVGVGTEAAETALSGRPETWAALRCTRIVYEV